VETLTLYRNAVERALEEYASVPYANGDYTRELIMDRERDRYLLVTLGWDGKRRVYYPVIHIDIVDSKIWIQHDGTETGIVTDLISAGVPKQQIVLAFYPVEARELSEYAAA